MDRQTEDIVVALRFGRRLQGSVLVGDSRIVSAVTSWRLLDGAPFYTRALEDSHTGSHVERLIYLPVCV